MLNPGRVLMPFAILTLTTLAMAEDIRFGAGSWDDNAFGNHRAVVRVEQRADAVLAHIPWRRRDAQPEKKEILIVDGATGLVIKNLARLEINREFGDLVFQPVTVPGDYYVYYLPYKTLGRSNYPKVVYPEPSPSADADWLSRNGLGSSPDDRPRPGRYPEARLVSLQAIDPFNSFDPMEVIAAANETKSLLAAHPEAAYLLFPEDRRFPIRMTDDLPRRWIERGPTNRFEAEALRGEFFVFQVGVYACRENLTDLSVSMSDLHSKESSQAIPGSAFRCINLGGINWDGRPLRKSCSVDPGNIQALWCGLSVPADCRPGAYEATVTVSLRNQAASSFRLLLRVRPEIIKDHGDDELWRQSRLRWLDSIIALDDDPVAPYSVVAVDGRTLEILGRSLTMGSLGLPASLMSFFSPDVTGLLSQGREILAGPMALVIEAADGSSAAWQDVQNEITDRKTGLVRWRAESRAPGFSAVTEAQLEFDGFAQFQVKLTAESAHTLKDISLRIPVRREAARYMMGLGFKGGLRPSRFHWMWDARNNQDALWIGDVNAGFQCSLRGENYSRPLNTNFYQSKPLLMPPAWYNNGRGGVLVEDQPDGTVLIKAYSGPRRVEKGETLCFFFNLLLTPFKPLDTRAQFSTRFFHAYKPVDEVIAAGANTINIHHANAINPYINYPFLRPEAMKKYIDEAHARGLRVKIYDTIRELSNHAVELFALRSLGDEIFSRGPGGGFSWLQEHLVSDYIAAWFVPELKDAAIINSGMSRWHNYYLEGLDWLCRKVGIDGLYIDDVAFDRTTMKRVRKILDRNRPAALIDLHSANQYNPRDGYASSANLYLEHFPYLNRLWFGEYFDYNASPDYWLVEISGIPFGLMGEMLEGGGNPWRGMVYGMTNRLPWSGNNPARLWKVWDEFGIVDSRMIGYWSEDCPVRTGNEAVLATAYVKPDRTMVALASWAKERAQVKLNIDWKALGLDPARTILEAPAIPDFQDARTFRPGDSIPVDSGKGWLIIITQKEEH